MKQDRPEQQKLVQNIFNALPEIRKFHNTDNPLFRLLHKEVEDYFTNRNSDKILVEPYSDILFPQVSLGNFESDIYLHAIEEFVIRAFYARNVARYKTFFDIGSNVGSDAIFAASLGWQVDAFEPDPDNYRQLQANIEMNGFKMCERIAKRFQLFGEN